MRLFLVLLLLGTAISLSAIPVPPHSSESDSSQHQDPIALLVSSEDGDSEDTESPLTDSNADDKWQRTGIIIENESNASTSEEEAATDRTISKRDIPDPEPCGCDHGKTSVPEAKQYDLYLANKDPYKRDRRHVDADNTSEEQNSSENNAVETKTQRVAAARRGRREEDYNDNVSEQQKSSQEEEDIKLKNPQKGNPVSVLDYFMEDYAQGCEETEINSDEANETTYDEKRRKREVTNVDTSKSLDSSDEGTEKKNNDDDDAEETFMQMSDEESFFDMNASNTTELKNRNDANKSADEALNEGGDEANHDTVVDSEEAADSFTSL